MRPAKQKSGGKGFQAEGTTKTKVLRQECLRKRKIANVSEVSTMEGWGWAAIQHLFSCGEGAGILFYVHWEASGRF